VPDQWQVQNGRAQVVLLSPQQDAAILFQSAGTESQATPSSAAQTFVDQSQGTLLRREQARVAGTAAVRTLVRLTSDQGTRLVLSTFFDYAGQTWVFHGLSAESAYPGFESTFRQPPDGFAQEQDPEILATAPVRLKIVDATGGDFQALVQRWPVPEGAELPSADATGLALLNGMEVSDRPARGQALKVLVRER
jgi:predicted Zn-dependent protease